MYMEDSPSVTASILPHDAISYSKCHEGNLAGQEEICVEVICIEISTIFAIFLHLKK